MLDVTWKQNKDGTESANYDIPATSSHGSFKYKVTIYEDNDGSWGYYIANNKADGETGFIDKTEAIEAAEEELGVCEE